MDYVKNDSVRIDETARIDVNNRNRWIDLIDATNHLQDV